MYRISCVALLCALVLALLYQPQLSASDIVSSHANVLLLTAHPDDECMFFAPTIQALTRTNAHVYSLCLSLGDADGLGPVRREELGRSLDVLGVPADRRWVVDHPDLQDNFTAHWNPETIANVIQPYVTSLNISTILTFDAGGVSGHPNHKSLPEGAAHLLIHRGRNLVRLFTLVTRPVLPKYMGILAPLSSKLSLYQHRIPPFLNAEFNQIFRSIHLAFSFNPKTKAAPQRVVISGIPEYLTALKAMCAHASQLVWFRWLYVIFSRYMWVNEWVEIPVHQVL